jgi:very-short-patch-repair endonuclease
MLSRPEVNAIVHGYEVDMLWRPQRLIAELDGLQHIRAFEEDRERDAHLLAHGLSTIRITWKRLTRTPSREASRLRSLLEPKIEDLQDFAQTPRDVRSRT